MKKHQQGITLVEIIIVVVITGILLAMGIPSFQQWMRNVQLRNAAETMLTGLQKAKTAALQQNSNVTFWLVANNGGVLDNTCTLSTSGTGWVVSVDDPENLCARDTSSSVAPRIVAKQAPGDAYRIAAINAGTGTNIVFNGLGRTVASANQITQIDISGSNATADDRAYRILVTSGGAIRMCEPAVTAATDNRKC